MTPLEQEALDMLLEVRDALTGRTLTNKDYIELMGHVMQTIKHLEGVLK